MTGQTRALIDKFASSGDITLIPSIIIGMQEEDNVSNVIQFKNCFRQIRNLAAHEPAVIISQIMNSDNRMCNRIVFTPTNEEVATKVVVSMVQFTAWMFEMYTRTMNTGYLIFWRALWRRLYGKCAAPSNVKFSFYDGPNYTDTASMVRMFLRWQTYMAETRNVQRVVSTKDDYMTEILNSNIKLFWRMAIVDMMSVCNVFASGDIDLSDIHNIKSFLHLFKVREGDFKDDARS